MKFEKLKNIVEVKKGKKPSFVETPDENSVRVLQIDDLRNDTNPKFTNDKTGVFAKEDDVLIAWDGANAGTIGYGKSGYIGSTIALLRKKKPDLYSTTFIGIFLQSKYQYLRSKATGSTIPHISRKALDELEVPVISVNDQLHIANLLSKAEILIAQRKESIRLLDEFLKSTFLEMFGDPVRNEKGWEETTLGQLFRVASGEGLTSENMNTNGKFNVYGGNGINGKHDKYMFEKPVIVIGRVGYYCGSVHLTEPNSWVTDNALYIKELYRVLNIIYLKHFLTLLNLNRVAGQAAQPLVSGNRIYPIKTYYPPIELQAQFAQIVEKTEALKTQYQQSLTELENLYGSLSQKAFKGELSIKNQANL